MLRLAVDALASAIIFGAAAIWLPGILLRHLRRGGLTGQEVFAGHLVRILILLAGIAVLLAIWGGEAVSLLAGSTVALAIALGLSTALSNTFDGALLVLERRFQVGDELELTPGGFSGTVTDIGLRSIVLASAGVSVVVPNSVLFSSAVRITHMKG